MNASPAKTNTTQTPSPDSRNPAPDTEDVEVARTASQSNSVSPAVSGLSAGRDAPPTEAPSRAAKTIPGAPVSETSGEARVDAGAAQASLPPAAQRALAEADARRRERQAQKDAVPPKELGGRDGPDPVRHGDWERKGIAVDF